MLKPQPQRTCIGCGAKKPQNELMRLAAQSGGAPIYDETGRAPGRGAYLCAQIECVEKAWKRRAPERMLKLQENAPTQLRDELLRRLSD